MLHEELITSRNMNDEPQTVCQDLIIFVNCIKNSPRGRHFEKICDDMKPKHTAVLPKQVMETSLANPERTEEDPLTYS
jgi:hypothetical protein